jgi:hypothetical protein
MDEWHSSDAADVSAGVGGRQDHHQSAMRWAPPRDLEDGLEQAPLMRHGFEQFWVVLQMRYFPFGQKL